MMMMKRMIDKIQVLLTSIIMATYITLTVMDSIKIIIITNNVDEPIVNDKPYVARASPYAGARI